MENEAIHNTVTHNKVCGDAQPQRVLHFFEEICRIPHGSYHIEEISNYLTAFAQERGLEYLQDSSFNVIIRKDATKGAASRETLIVQGHMDMVLEKEKDCPLDLETQPIVLRCDGEYLYAEGTTLGGDDGIAVAMMLALLDDDTLVHPPLECVFTVNEEVGLQGATALDASVLSGRRMINLDSEKEGVFIVGCAGGAEENVVLPLKRKAHAGRRLTLTIEGLLGGHSGECINLGRANADLLMGRILHRLEEKEKLRLISLEGGRRDNAIPRSCTAELLLKKKTDPARIEELISGWMEQLRAEYAQVDPDITWSLTWGEPDGEQVRAITRRDTGKIIDYLMLVPNGIMETEPGLDNLPRTSVNLGILRTTKTHLEMVHMARSSVESQKEHLLERIHLLACTLGGDSRTEHSYPAWERKSHSALCDKMAGIYEDLTGEKPQVAVFHAGLECGLFTDKIKDLDCLSMGPDMMNVHTSEEKLSLSSVQRTWAFLLAVLKAI